jgi:uncharacterized protein (TIGR03118 family)
MKPPASAAIHVMKQRSERMTIAQRSPSVLKLVLLAGFALSLGNLAEAQHYLKADLVSDLSGTTTTDSNLMNPWGLSRNSTGPWWVSDNGAGVATVYDGTGAPFPSGTPIIVTIPPAPGGTTGVPTGTVYNGTADFEITKGNPAKFLFVTEDGTISGWNGGAAATIMSTDTDAVYKGAAIASLHGANFLYVTNFKRRRVDVFDAAFMPVKHKGEKHRGPRLFEFEDERIPRGFSPFNVQNIGGNLYVTFAKVDPATLDDVKGAGLGFVDVFSPDGRLLRRLEHGRWLNAPWGVALAPGDFGAFSHHVLVGQFGSGEIAAYNAVTGRFVGKVKDDADNVLAIDGLWALSFGNGATAGPLNTLFFTAGIEDEAHGLFGTLTAVPAEQLLGNGF